MSKPALNSSNEPTNPEVAKEVELLREIRRFLAINDRPLTLAECVEMLAADCSLRLLKMVEPEDR